MDHLRTQREMDAERAGELPDVMRPSSGGKASATPASGGRYAPSNAVYLGGVVPRSVAAQHQEALSSMLTKLSAAAQKAISAVDVADNLAIDIDVPAALAAVADQTAVVQRMLSELANGRTSHYLA